MSAFGSDLYCAIHGTSITTFAFPWPYSPSLMQTSYLEAPLGAAQSRNFPKGYLLPLSFSLSNRRVTIPSISGWIAWLAASLDNCGTLLHCLLCCLSLLGIFLPHTKICPEAGPQDICGKIFAISNIHRKIRSEQRAKERESHSQSRRRRGRKKG